MTRPAGARGELSPRMQAQRQRRLRAVPLLEAVRAFLAEGLPMTHSGYGVACAFCGASMEALLGEGHAEDCRWRRLRERVAGEA